MKQITVIVPSLATLKGNVYSIPQELPDLQLVRKYGQLKAGQAAWVAGKLPASYYCLSAYGRVPKDSWALSQLTTAIKDFEAEIGKRNLFEKYELMVKI